MQPSLDIAVSGVKLCMRSTSCSTGEGMFTALDQSADNGLHMTGFLVMQPDKLERAQAAYKYFVEGDRGALRDFPGGSEPGS